MATEKRYVIIVAALVLLFSLLYLGLVYLQIGAPVKAEWWLKSVYDVKNHLAKQTKGPKILIIGGSNSLFGIDSSIIHKETGLPVVNLSGHAGLDISFHYHKLKQHLSDGDIVVMPLEFGYFQQKRVTDWFANNMLAWGQEDYLQLASPNELFQFLTAVPKSRIYNGLLNIGNKKPIAERKQVIARFKVLQGQEENGWRGYNYDSLNRYGDIVSGSQLTPRMKKMCKRGFHYYGGWEISPRFISYYKKIESLTRKRNGTLFLTWAVMMKNPKFDLTSPQHQKRINKIQASLEKQDIYFTCDARDFQFTPDQFFDTRYHLNNRAAVVRSQKLAECLVKK